ASAPRGGPASRATLPLVWLRASLIGLFAAAVFGCVPPPPPTGGACDLSAGHPCGSNEVCFHQQCVSPTAKGLVFISPEIVAGAGACSPAVTVQARNAYDAPLVAAADVLVTLSSSPAAVSFYSDATCTLPANGLTLAAGSNQVQFFFVAPT